MYQSSRTIFNGVNPLSALKPAVTVIIPAYNAASALRICLHALLRQDYPSEKFRVIVVNDGSTDTTAEIFREMNLPENFRLVEH
ncbi:MAG: glycosyltransferase, partial [Candidatus Neomarinimicrobiota bacterium]